MKRLIILLASLVMLCGVVSVGALPEKEDIPVRLAYQKMSAYSATFIAQEKGYFKEEGLEIEMILVSSGEVAVDAMLAGKMDVARPHTLVPMVLEYTAPGRVKIIELGSNTSDSNTETQPFIVKSDSNMNSLADLEGKKIAITANKLNAVILKIVLSKVFDPSNTTFIPIPFQEHINALQNGSVDAAAAPEPVSSVAIASGNFRYLDSSYTRANYIVDPFHLACQIVSSQFMKKYPEGAKKLQSAFAKAAKFLSENPAESRVIIAKYTGYPLEVCQRMRLYRESIPTEDDLPALQKLVDIYFEHGFLKSRVDPYDLILW